MSYNFDNAKEMLDFRIFSEVPVTCEFSRSSQKLKKGKKHLWLSGNTKNYNLSVNFKTLLAQFNYPITVEFYQNNANI